MNIKNIALGVLVAFGLVFGAAMCSALADDAGVSPGDVVEVWSVCADRTEADQMFEYARTGNFDGLTELFEDPDSSCLNTDLQGVPTIPGVAGEIVKKGEKVDLWSVETPFGTVYTWVTKGGKVEEVKKPGQEI